MSEIFISLALVLLLYIGAMVLVGVKLLEEIPVLKKSRVERLKKEKSTYFLDKEKFDIDCGICFGSFKNEETVMECTCGKVFHIDCCELTKECPYCKQVLKKMRSRSVKKQKCPICGKVMEGNICECGTVLPERDGYFECVCGNALFSKRDHCDRCGAKYESSYIEKHR